MYGQQSGEFVCGYWGLKVNLLATNFASVTADPKPAITQ